MQVLTEKTEHVLTNVGIGHTHKVIQVSDLLIAKRLFAMGLLPGTLITLVRKGSFSGTCYVKFGMITLALRAEEAAAIEVA